MKKYINFINEENESNEIIIKELSFHDFINVCETYPDIKFKETDIIYNYDVFNLPFEDNNVDEVIADAFIEHLSFSEEKLIFEEIKRVLKPGGKFNFSVPNFEKNIKMWLDAEDDWKEFFRSDDEAINQQHWFGTYTYEPKNRWGYLTAMIFGTQNGEGQLHKNCYTIPKIKAILNKLNFSQIEISEFRWKENRDFMIQVNAIK